MFRRGIVLAAFLALAACDKKPPALPDAPPMDDAAPPDPDAPPMPDAAPPPQGQEITSGGGRVQGASFILDVQVGHGVVQQPAQGSATIVQGNAPVKP
jgi:hypothetical protein